MLEIFVVYWLDSKVGGLLKLYNGITRRQIVRVMVLMILLNFLRGEKS
jgi:hypothetical protein